MSKFHAKLTLLPRKTHAKSTLIPRKIHGKKSRDMRNSTFVSVSDINITLTVLYVWMVWLETNFPGQTGFSGELVIRWPDGQSVAYKTCLEAQATHVSSRSNWAGPIYVFLYVEIITIEE